MMNPKKQVLVMKRIVLPIVILILLLSGCGSSTPNDPTAYNVDIYNGVYDLYQLNWDMNMDDAIEALKIKGKLDGFDENDIKLDNAMIKDISKYISVYNGNVISVKKEDKSLPKVCGIEISGFSFQFLVDDYLDEPIARRVWIFPDENSRTKSPYTYDEIISAFEKYYGDSHFTQESNQNSESNSTYTVWEGEKTTIAIENNPDDENNPIVIWFYNSLTLYRP